MQQQPAEHVDVDAVNVTCGHDKAGIFSDADIVASGLNCLNERVSADKEVSHHETTARIARSNALLT